MEALSQVLMGGPNSGSGPALVQGQVKTDERECRRDGRHSVARVLRGVRIDRKLMEAAKLQQVLELVRQYLRADLPARRRNIRPTIDWPVADG